jgi:hypothetical protein
MIEPAGVSFVFPDVFGRKVLVLGLGGGCDAITAYAVAGLLDAGPGGQAIYANTKNGPVGQTEAITPHVLRITSPTPLPGERARSQGRAWIDHSVPRGSGGSPWIVLLDGDGAERDLVGEITSLGFDLVIGVDAGGDSIASKGGRGHLGRDQRMLRILRQTGLPLLHIVVAPGCDGEASYEDLLASFQRYVARGQYRGSLSLEPMLPVYRSFSSMLGPTRTPRLILAAADGLLKATRDGKVIVPRGCKPAVPAHWLTTGFVVAPEPLATRGSQTP